MRWLVSRAASFTSSKFQFSCRQEEVWRGYGIRALMQPYLDGRVHARADKGHSSTPCPIDSENLYFVLHELLRGLTLMCGHAGLRSFQFLIKTRAKETICSGCSPA